MVAQLLAAGYLLHLLFALRNVWAVLLVLVVMGAFAVQTAASRVQNRLPGLYRIISLSLLVGCGGCTFFFCTLVIGLKPWYDPRYLIPLAGMVFGNALTGASLAAERLVSELRQRRDEIEAALCLGASPAQASAEVVRSAFRAALMPTVNAMAAMGLVFLPGMMTGQILSGTEPILAVRYQIAVMCVITGSVAISAYLILLQGARACFTPAAQLRRELIYQQPASSNGK
jgi:putative ABC transport system permease protein